MKKTKRNVYYIDIFVKFDVLQGFSYEIREKILFYDHGEDGDDKHPFFQRILLS